MHTIESIATKLGIALTSHQLEMARAIEWLTAPSVEPEKRGRTLLLGLAALAQAANQPESRVLMTDHSFIVDSSDGFNVASTTRRVMRGLINLVQGRTQDLGGDFSVDGMNRLRFVPRSEHSTESARRDLEFAVAKAEKAVVEAVLTDAWSGGMHITRAKAVLKEARERLKDEGWVDLGGGS